MIPVILALIAPVSAAPPAPESALRTAGATVDAPGPSGELRFTLPGAFGALWVAPSDAEVGPLWEGAARTLASRWPPAAAPLPGEAALGDGVAVLLVREGRAVLFLRAVDPVAAVAGRADPGLAARAAAILSALRGPGAGR